MFQTQKELPPANQPPPLLLLYTYSSPINIKWNIFFCFPSRFRAPLQQENPKSIISEKNETAAKKYTLHNFVMMRV